MKRKPIPPMRLGGSACVTAPPRAHPRTCRACRSVAMFVGMGYETVLLTQKLGSAEWIFCVPPGTKAEGRLYFWSYIYYLSKARRTSPAIRSGPAPSARAVRTPWTDCQARDVGSALLPRRATDCRTIPFTPLSASPQHSHRTRARAPSSRFPSTSPSSHTSTPTHVASFQKHKQKNSTTSSSTP